MRLRQAGGLADGHAHRRHTRVHGPDAVQPGRHREHPDRQRRDPEAREPGRDHGRSRSERRALPGVRRPVHAVLAQRTVHGAVPGRVSAAHGSDPDADQHVERGDPNITSITDLINKSTFFYDIQPDANFPDIKAGLVSQNSATTLSLANYFETRFTYQIVVLQCMAKYNLDALVSSSGNVPAY